MPSGRFDPIEDGGHASVPATDALRAARLLERVVALYEANLSESPRALEFLARRGLGDRELLGAHRVGYAAGHLHETLPQAGKVLEELKALGVLSESGQERFDGCVVFPVTDIDGNLITLYGRLIGESSAPEDIGGACGPARHVLLPGRPAGLWNAPALKVYPEIVAMGDILDALSVVAAGRPNVVAFQGAQGLSDGDIARMRHAGVKRIVLMPDGDNPGPGGLPQRLLPLVPPQPPLPPQPPPPVRESRAKPVARREALRSVVSTATDAVREPAGRERDDAESFGRRPDLIDAILADFQTCGLVGERANKLLVYLAAVSRKMPEPLSVLIDPETKSRFIVTSVDESREQTRAILAFQRRREGLDGLLACRATEAILKRHHDFQRLLRPLAIVNPIHDRLSYADDRLQGRRDQPKFLALIRAVAFLRQMRKEVKHPDLRALAEEPAPAPQSLGEIGLALRSLGEAGLALRSLGEVGYIEVDAEDVTLATRLAHDILGHSLDELSRPSRNLLYELERMVQQRTTNKEPLPYRSRGARSGSSPGGATTAFTSI